MTSYFTLLFLGIFLPLTVVVYAAVPKKARWVVLLLASYAFFFALSRTLILALVASTLSIYLCGRGMGALIARRDEALAQAKSGKKEIRKTFARKMKWVMVAGLLVNFGLLAAYKYLHFFASIIDGGLALIGIHLNIQLPVWAAPIGISFYTLMAGSYLVDVFRGTIPAEKNLGKVALFLGFFPQIMEGPIARFGQTADQLMAGNPVTRANLYAGTLRMLYGLCKKIIVADRLNAFVKLVFDNYGCYDGGMIALGAVLYTLQLYCDFSGTMDLALGMGRIFGVTLPENFRQPFFSRTASGFWQRWHITLGSWLRDYVYYPVSLSKPAKTLTKHARKKLGNRYGPLLASSLALICVWLGNGLWHGAGSQYLFFGIYYFVLIVAGSLIEPTAARLAERLHVSRESVGLAGLPNCPHAGDYRGGRAVLPRQRPRGRFRDVRHHGCRVHVRVVCEWHGAVHGHGRQGFRRGGGGGCGAAGGGHPARARGGHHRPGERVETAGPLGRVVRGVFGAADFRRLRGGVHAG